MELALELQELSVSAKDPPCAGGIFKILDLLFYFFPFLCELHLQQ